ncbi:hypothetical protein ACM9XB_00575 [Xanthomonas sacchari]
MRGSDLTVVRRSRQTIESSDGHVYSIAPGAALQTADAFWYCLGPGPSGFLAMPVVTPGFGKAQVHWIVLPMTEGRMRVALQFDRKATRLAFGTPPGCALSPQTRARQPGAHGAKGTVDRVLAPSLCPRPARWHAP